jgi:predicted enzyme related to lactoylglutathione lyase
MAWSHGKFYWNELMTRDVEDAKRFYTELLGWSFEAMPMGPGKTYWIAKANGEMVGGFFDISAPEFEELSECWMSYISVDNVDARAAKATAAGAKLMKPAFDIPSVGRIAILLDPGDAMIALITPSN